MDHTPEIKKRLLITDTRINSLDWPSSWVVVCFFFFFFFLKFLGQAVQPCARREQKNKNKTKTKTKHTHTGGQTDVTKCIISLLCQSYAVDNYLEILLIFIFRLLSNILIQICRSIQKMTCSSANSLMPKNTKTPWKW